VPDIIHTAIDVIALPGVSPRAAARLLVDSLNAELGAAYDTARLGQWRRGERPIPQPVQDWLLRVAIAHAIRQCGGLPPADDAALDRLAAMLCPPKQNP
jgi:hypothetical protein